MRRIISGRTLIRHGSSYHLPPIQHIVRESLIKALGVAQARNLPIDTYWICASDEFKVIITASVQRITRVVLTPSSPDDAPLHRSERARALTPL
jgi:hypothetical protein